MFESVENKNKALNVMNQRKGSWYQGYYEIENKDKYLGQSKIIEYRSSWEKRVAYYLDHNSQIKRWGYETIKIPYRSIDNRIHHYIVDFYVELIDNMGNLQKYLLEVKPKKDGPKIIDGRFDLTNRPQPPKNNNSKAIKRYYYESTTYAKNASKWSALDSYCRSNGLKFKIITEDNIKKMV